MKEKKFITIYRLIFAIIVGINILLPIILLSCRTDLELIESNVYAYYDDTSGYSSCDVELIFNKKISSGSATISFYDINGNLISSDTAYFSENSKIVTDEITYIDGEIDSYEIEDIDFSTELNFLDFSYLIFYFLPLTLVLFILSFRSSCKEYDYKNYKILIYAGFCKHYIKVNDEKTDEYNSSIAYTPIKLSCTLDNGDKLDVTISLTNRVSLKINDKLFSK